MQMDARQIIEKVRDQAAIDKAEIDWFARGLANGQVSDAQAGAFAMAVLLNGMADEEKIALTLAMRDSGDVMSWSAPSPAIDKHSTGGIGDCVSLLLAPALAALGGFVPMVSGRGLGHTGGTLDKLEAIPGLATEVSQDRFVELMHQLGFAIVSATGAIAPADKRLYAIRDVTGTVESVDLITASILSKKLSAGLDALVLDVKCGSGAFMKTPQDAQTLAESLVAVANGAGCKTTALITDMNQPCCPWMGNALEVMGTMEAMTSGSGDNHLCDLTCALGGELLVLAGMSDDAAQAGEDLRGVLQDGSAAERFAQMIAAMGGPKDFVENWRDRLPAAPVVRDIVAPHAGYVGAMNGHALGMAVVHLGGGRLVGGDVIDPAVGFSNICMLGDKMGSGDLLATVHAASEAEADAAQAAVLGALTLQDSAPAKQPLIMGRIGAEDLT